MSLHLALDHLRRADAYAARRGVKRGQALVKVFLTGLETTEQADGIPASRVDDLMAILQAFETLLSQFGPAAFGTLIFLAYWVAKASVGRSKRMSCSSGHAPRVRTDGPKLWRKRTAAQEFLEGRENAFVVLGCGSAERVLGIPYARLKEWRDGLWTTERDDGRRYWHLRIQQDGNKLLLDRRKGQGGRTLANT